MQISTDKPDKLISRTDLHAPKKSGLSGTHLYYHEKPLRTADYGFYTHPYWLQYQFPYDFDSNHHGKRIVIHGCECITGGSHLSRIFGSMKICLAYQ